MFVTKDYSILDYNSFGIFFKIETRMNFNKALVQSAAKFVKDRFRKLGYSINFEKLSIKLPEVLKRAKSSKSKN